MPIDAKDSPWRRLPWTLPSALALGAAALWAIAYFTGKPVKRLPEPPAIEAQVVELPPPITSKPPPPEKSVPRTPQTPVIQRPAIIEQPAVKPTAVTPVAPVVPAPPTPPTPPVQDTSKTNLTGNSAPQAIVKPMPEIPDELRQDALNAVAIVRFHVAIDGAATVEIVQPTPHPRLNRLLLDTLKNWRFFPAIKDGQPVESVYPLTFRFEVQ
jgi:periplasmic protein TonB